jgi:hypothetical protein
MFPLDVQCHLYFTVHRKRIDNVAEVSHGNTYLLNGSTLYVDSVLKRFVPDEAEAHLNAITVKRGDTRLVALASA